MDADLFGAPLSLLIKVSVCGLDTMLRAQEEVAKNVLMPLSKLLSCLNVQQCATIYNICLEHLQKKTLSSEGK